MFWMVVLGACSRDALCLSPSGGFSELQGQRQASATELS